MQNMQLATQKQMSWDSGGMFRLSCLMEVEMDYWPLYWKRAERMEPIGVGVWWQWRWQWRWPWRWEGLCKVLNTCREYFFRLGSEPGNESLSWTTNTNFYPMHKWYEKDSSGCKTLTHHCYLCSDQVENIQIPSGLFFAEWSFSTVDQADRQPIRECYWNARSVWWHMGWPVLFGWNCCKWFWSWSQCCYK